MHEYNEENRTNKPIDKGKKTNTIEKERSKTGRKEFLTIWKQTKLEWQTKDATLLNSYYCIAHTTIPLNCIYCSRSIYFLTDCYGASFEFFQVG